MAPKAPSSNAKPSKVPITSFESHFFDMPPQYKASSKHCIAATMRTKPGMSICRNFSLKGTAWPEYTFCASGVEKVRKMIAAAKPPIGRLM